MKNRVLGTTGLVLVLLGLIATICVFAFERTIRDWGDPEVLALGTAIICLAGCVLGWASFKTAEGKAAAVIGSVLVLFFAWQYVRSERPSEAALPIRAPDPVQSQVFDGDH